MTAESKASEPTDWGVFMRHAIDYVDAGRLVACFDDAFDSELCERLRGTGRLRQRLSELVERRSALPARIAEDAIDDVDRTIALSPAERLLDLIRRAGAIYWANAIANVVRAEEVRWLREQLGEALCALALANRDLSGPGETFEPLESARERIAEAGERCFEAWCRSVPAAVAARVRLKLPAAPGPGEGEADPFATIGSSIVRRAAG